MINLDIKIKKYPALYSALAMIFGILSSYFIFKFKSIIFVKLLLLIEIIFLIYYLIFLLNYNKKSIYLLLFIIFLLVGSFLYVYEEFKYQSQYSINNFANSSEKEIIARVIFDLGDLESEKIYLKPIKIDNKKVKYGKILSYSKKLKSLKHNDLISLNLTLTKPKDAMNPGAFEFANYLRKEGVYLQGWEPQNIKLIKHTKNIKNIVIQFKRKLIENINLLFKAKNAAFIKAILLGEKDDLTFAQKDLLRNSGASHLLAISGLHMGIIIFTFSFILFNIFSKKRNALYVLSILTFIYIIIVGAAVSIIRASLLALLFLWADEFNCEANFINILAFTLLVNLLINPFALFSVSLQLSYLLVLSLFYISPLLSKILPLFLSVSLAAQLGAFAVSVFYFNEYAWIALITNLWLIPVITLLLPIIFLIVLLSLFCFNYLSLFIFIIEFSLDLLFSALNLMIEIQGLAFVIARPKIILVILYYLILFSLPLVYKKYHIVFNEKKFIIWRKILPILLLMIIFSFFNTSQSDFLEVNYLAVGQGDGIFIKFPNGKNMIIDTGPPGNEGRNIEYNIISFLNFSGIKKIDYLLISHFDADHVGGMKHLLKRKKVEKILIPPFNKKTFFHQQLEQELTKNSSLSFSYLKENMKFEISNCQLKILNPPVDNIFKDRNENSIVLLLNYKRKKFLFTGDLAKRGEKRIIEKFKPGKIDVLKVGHHGSNTSTGKSLLSHCSPMLAVISVGKNNFGHPDPAVIKRLNENKIKYLRTDKAGMVKVISDGMNIWFNSYK